MASLNSQRFPVQSGINSVPPTKYSPDYISVPRPSVKYVTRNVDQAGTGGRNALHVATHQVSPTKHDIKIVSLPPPPPASAINVDVLGDLSTNLKEICCELKALNKFLEEKSASS